MQSLYKFLLINIGIPDDVKVKKNINTISYLKTTSIVTLNPHHIKKYNIEEKIIRDMKKRTPSHKKIRIICLIVTTVT